jgi:hypothetical protein
MRPSRSEFVVGRDRDSDALAAHAPYAAAWEDLRRRQWVMWGVYLAFFPGKWLIAAVYAKLPNYHSPQIFVIAGCAWIVAFVVSSYWAADWRCPRCHEVFIKGTWYRNPCARYCLSCGLRRGAPNGTEPGISS